MPGSVEQPSARLSSLLRFLSIRPFDLAPQSFESLIPELFHRTNQPAVQKSADRAVAGKSNRPLVGLSCLQRALDRHEVPPERPVWLMLSH